MQTTNSTSTRSKGKFAEDLALNYLKNKGFELIERNFTVKGGELDLIMKKEPFIVFVEVKSLKKDSPYSIYNSLSNKKKKFLKYTIDRWLLKNNLKDKPWRLDFVGIQKDGKSYQIDHFEFITL